VALFFCVLFVNVSFLDPFEKAFEDFSFNDLYYSEGFYEKTTTKEIIMVNVQHASRFEIAQAIQQVSQSQPQAIGIDLLFKELKEPYSDSLLRDALYLPRVVTASYLDDTAMVVNHDYFRSASETTGFVNLDQPDGGRVIREFNSAQIADDTLFSFAAQLVAVAGNSVKADPINRLSQYRPIDYRIGSQQFLT